MAAESDRSGAGAGAGAYETSNQPTYVATLTETHEIMYWKS